MKKIIEGKLYNTETAREIAAYDNGGGWRDFHHIEETLYRKKNGEYFLLGEGGAASKYAEKAGLNGWDKGSRIMPMSYDDAKKWMEKHCTADEYEAEFGEASKDDSTVTMCITLPASTANKLRKQAGEAGMPMSRYIAKWVENH